ncbi:MAG: hypothetical protein HYR84_02020, partial [Planctomycetes bacterium]|nr:hypothetical protein [Planctomycetota bacterium]
MLLSCFQCRQQLDVPEDSAGKRVRCPHCLYVIVVPAKPKAVETDEGTGTGPAMALPSMELDADPKSAPVTKISPQPLPPVAPPAPETHPLENKPSEAKPDPSSDDLPPVPSIEVGAGRRKLMSPAPASNVPWGKIIGIGGVIGVVLIGIIIAVATSSRPRPQPMPMVKNPIIQQMPFPNQGMKQPFPNLNNPIQNFQNLPFLQWTTVSFRERRFKVQMPGKHEDLVEMVNDTQMKVFSVQHGDWQFSIAHALIGEKDFQAKAINDRFLSLEQYIRDTNPGARRNNPNPAIVLGEHQGRDWEFQFDPFGNQQILRVRTYFVRDGARYHHYLLRVRFPANFGANPAPVLQFFNGFALIADEGSFLEETDSMLQGARRDNEFLSLAMHPKEPIFAVGSVAARIKIGRVDGGALDKAAPQAAEKIDVVYDDSKSIEQLAISPDGRFLAASIPGEIEFWRDWATQAPKNKTVIRGG